MMAHSKQCPCCSLPNLGHSLQCSCGYIFELDQVTSPNPHKSPLSWYLQALEKYAVFDGRSRRKEYWYFFLFNLLAGLVFIGIDAATGALDGQSKVGLLGPIFALVVFLPGVAVSVRRLHDTGHAGWWVLLNLFPFGGPILFLPFMIQDSTQNGNRYGLNPKNTAV